MADRHAQPRFRRAGTAALSAIALAVSALAVGACDELDKEAIEERAEEQQNSPGQQQDSSGQGY